MENSNFSAVDLWTPKFHFALFVKTINGDVYQLKLTQNHPKFTV